MPAGRQAFQPASDRDSKPAGGSVEAVDRGPVVVGELGRFEGLVTFRERAQIHGDVQGDIVSRGTLWLGETARVTGSIQVGELIIGGTVEGEVTASERVQLSPTAVVRGVVRAPRVSMEEGSLLEGRCETTAPSGTPD